MFQDKLKAVSFFPQMTDFHGQLVYKPITEQTYHCAKQSLKEIDYSNLGETATAPSGCDSAGCDV